MLLTEDTIVALTVNAFDLKKVVGSASTLNMEGYHASAVLTLNAGTAVALATDYALQVEPLSVYFAHSDWGLRRNEGPWDPHGARQVYPFVEGLGWNRLRAFQPLLVPLQEEGVVFGDLGDRLRLQEVQVDLVLWKIGVFVLLRLQDQRLLEVAFTAQDRTQRVVPVLPLKKLQTLVTPRACLLLHLQPRLFSIVLSGAVVHKQILINGLNIYLLLLRFTKIHLLLTLMLRLILIAGLECQIGEIVLVLQALLFLGSLVIPHKVLMRSE